LVNLGPHKNLETFPIEELNLEGLDGGCHIQAAAGHALGQLLGKCPQLKKADLRGNLALFTKEGLEDLVRGIGSAALPIEQLHLNDCDIQPAAGHALGQLLGKCPQLKLDAEHLLGVDANILDQLRAEMQKQGVQWHMDI
jgi:Ran GTPase-activating protein (RanGAP) involved in mRNA processing and transport